MNATAQMQPEMNAVGGTELMRVTHELDFAFRDVRDGSRLFIVPNAPRPGHLADAIGHLGASVNEVITVFDQLFANPYCKLWRQEMITESEYCFLRALNVLPNVAQVCGLLGTGLTEYETYRMLYCPGEPNGCRGIISTKPYRLSAHRTIGPYVNVCPVDPSDVHRSLLSPEQIGFFRTHFPEDFSRIQP